MKQQLIFAGKRLVNVANIEIMELIGTGALTVRFVSGDTNEIPADEVESFLGALAACEYMFERDPGKAFQKLHQT